MDPGRGTKPRKRTAFRQFFISTPVNVVGLRARHAPEPRLVSSRNRDAPSEKELMKESCLWRVPPRRQKSGSPCYASGTGSFKPVLGYERPRL